MNSLILGIVNNNNTGLDRNYLGLHFVDKNNNTKKERNKAIQVWSEMSLSKGW